MEGDGLGDDWDTNEVFMLLLERPDLPNLLLRLFRSSFARHDDPRI
jgi:hypothetical protein